MSNKIQTSHLERRAYVYVRQSTTQQVFENTESTARQYALVDRARALGWSDHAVEVIDEDLGRSAATAQDRNGFGRLAEAIAHGRAGAVFAIEVSRLARSSQDWQRLLALCAVAQVVVADEHAVYDPRNCDDKLLLDFKGTMSEAELHWLGLRLTGARRSKARRGALRFPAPTGYLWGEAGFELDPDESVQRAVRAVFERFAIEPTLHAVVRWAHRVGFSMPTRRCFADGTSELVWRPLGASRLKEILHSPIYAGAYAYGRRTEKQVLIDGEIRSVRESQPLDEWTALIRDAHPGYISWEDYVNNLEKLKDNAARAASTGAPREGNALLAGIVLCGRCGRRMRTVYPPGNDRSWRYVCPGDTDRGDRICWSVSGAAIDAVVEDLLLRMIIPDELDLCLAVEHEVDAQAASLHEQWKLRLEKAEYEARRAERRYMAVDPDNRVVARTLESQWEARLRELEQVRHRYESEKHARTLQLSNDDRSRIRALSRDLPAVWRAPTTKQADRKAMLRIAIEAVALRPIDVPERRTHIEVQWRSGATDQLTADRRIRRHTPDEAVACIRELAARRLHDDEIADRLNQEKLRTATNRPWTGSIVKKVRLKHAIARAAPTRPNGRRPLPDRHPDGRYSIHGVVARFGVPERRVRQWIEQGVVPAVREDFELYRRVWWITVDDVTAQRIEHGTHAEPHAPNSPTETYSDRGDAS